MALGKMRTADADMVAMAAFEYYDGLAGPGESGDCATGRGA